jgi:hypothetical protein
MTQEAAPAEVPFDPSTFDFSGLAGLDLSGLNFGSNFGGGPMGGIYQADPNLQYIGAPLSNKGNATSQTGGNTFAVRADQPVRLVDHRTNQIVFEGTGFDAARKATELGQGLTDQFGRKANYSIQTADPTGNYSTVAYEKKNKSTLGTIAGAVGTALPLATMFIPGLNVLGTIAAGAGLGGAGAALRGDDILKGVAMGGLSAAGGQVLGPALEAGGKFGTALAPKLATAVGTGLGSTAGGLATGQSLKNSLLGGVASGALSYLAPTVANELGLKPINLSGAESTSGSSGMTADGGLQVTASTLGAPSIGTTLGGSPNKIQQALEPKTETPYDGLSVTGGKLGSTFGVDLGGNRFGTPGSDTSALDRLTQPEPTEPVEEIDVLGNRIARATNAGLSPDVQAGIAEFEKNPIISEGSKIEQPTSVSVPVTSGLSPDVQAGIAEFEKNPIISEGSKIEQPTPVSVPVTGALPTDIVVNALGKEKGLPEGSVLADLGIPQVPTPDPALTDGKGKKLGVKDYIDIATLLMGLIPDGKGGNNSGGTIPTGMGALSSLFNKQLPPSTLPGGVGGGALPASTLAAQGFNSPQDYYRYGYGPEQSFFSYATQGAPNTSRAYTGYEGSTAENRFAPQPVRVATPPVALPQPITTPIPNNPAGPSMYAPEVDDMRFARGGFAVEGAGDGRDDKIPALLSDGEYVIDAETVALLGNGSNKAGAKLLDSFRVKVRKQKGKKLARGKFSDNAKRPEQYMAGGPA